MSDPDLKFKLRPDQLSSLIDPKSFTTLKSLGGPESISKDLDTSLQSGLSSQQLNPTNSIRQTTYGLNHLPTKPRQSLLSLMWAALQDKVLIILIIAAIVSLGLGLYTTLGTPPKTYTDSNGRTISEPQVDWVEGLAILIAVAIVTIVGSLNDYQKESQFAKLNEKKDDREIKLIREGRQTLVNVKDILVGDVGLIEPGEILPVDGIFIDGYGVKCDESSVTGESDLIKKISYEKLESLDHHDDDQFFLKRKVDCFMISGSKVVEGTGRYLVTGVGQNSFFGKIMMSLRGENENTPLQTKLNHLAELIAKLGATAGAILFVALMIRFFVQLSTDPDRTANQKAQSFIQVLIISVTIVVVAVPEGLPLAVTLALAFATRRMTKMKLLVRVLSSCETMANATVVCTDKTGTLTQNSMTVVAGSIGVHLKFAKDLSKNLGRIVTRSTEVDEEQDEEELVKESSDRSPQPRITVSHTKESEENRRLDFSIDQDQLRSSLDPKVVDLISQSISLNSTVFEQEDGTLVGSKTETALIKLSKEQGWEDFRKTRERYEIIKIFPFNSEKKSMGVIVKKLDGSGYRFLVKGASEVLSKLTNRYLVVNDRRDLEDRQDSMLETVEFDNESRANISRTIMCYANQSLRTIGLCYRDLEDLPIDDDLEYDRLLNEDGLTLLGIVGIEDPLREGVTEAVASCIQAGVGVKMVTGDNVLTAKSIATQCGIYQPGGIIMEGPVFRNLKSHEMLEISPRLQVLARSSPEDKKLLIDHLKRLGEICAVTGDGTNDGPALKSAHVGFSMGITGTEVAKEASDIILMDDNFASVVDAIMWGRCVNDSVKKFLQFQLSVNITAVLITFITSVASSSESSILTAVQLLWVNLIMDTFAALALATDPASRELLKRKPDHRRSPLITVEMWKMIIGQSMFQLVVILILNFLGKSIIGLDDDGNDESIRIKNDDIHKTIVFNTFVFCQIFNQFNARVLNREMNVFRGIFNNYYFLVILAIMIGGQILIVEVGGAAFQVTKLGIQYWGICLVIGFLSLPIGMLVKLLPTEPCERFYEKFIGSRGKTDWDVERQGTEGDEDEKSSSWNPAIDQVRDNLAIFAQIRGGRVRSSSFVRKSRHSMMKERGIHTGALMTMVPTLVVTSIGAGWQPYPSKDQRTSTLADPNSIDPSRSTAELWIKKVEVHPDTEPSDPMMIKFGQRIEDEKDPHHSNSSSERLGGSSRTIASSSSHEPEAKDLPPVFDTTDDGHSDLQNPIDVHGSKGEQNLKVPIA